MKKMMIMALTAAVSALAVNAGAIELNRLKASDLTLSVKTDGIPAAKAVPVAAAMPGAAGITKTGYELFSESGSMSRSCSGTPSGYGYFYLYAYQYAYINLGKVATESHSFSSSGFLSDVGNYAMQKQAMRHHIIYAGAKFAVAIPWKSDYGIYAIRTDDNNYGRSIQDGVMYGWELLCR